MSSISGGNTLRRLATKSLSSGAIDEEGFKHAFSTVRSLPISSSRDLSEYMAKINESLCVNAEDWERRLNALKDLRNVVGGGGHQMDEFPALLRILETPVLGCLQDLRSQVVREASITVAYLSQETGSKFDHFAEVIMQPLFNLIPNSAKIMSTSAITAIGFIIRNTFASRLFPIIAGGLSSKSNILRKYVCIFLDSIFRFWPVHVLQRHMSLIQEVLRKGVSDADQDARSATRSAFKSFAEKFPDQVETVLRNLDPTKRQAIERSLSNGNDDQSSLASGTSSRTASQTNLSSVGTRLNNRPAMGTSGLNSTTGRTANIGSFMFEMGRKNIGTVKYARSRAGMGKISLSQPASRESSPIRTPSEIDYNVGDSGSAKAYAKTLNSAINHRKGLAYSSVAMMRGFRKTSRPVTHSQEPSREVSPVSAVSGNAPCTYNAAGSVAHRRPSLSSMSDAGYSRGYSRRQYDSDDNASETSSVCSERSGQSMPVYRRNHFHMVNRLSAPRIPQVFGEIIKLLNSLQWSEKKEGLLNLKEYLLSGQPLSQTEVLRVAEVLSMIFGESSSKVITPFSVTLQLFIKNYHQFLHEWIYTAMVRLFNRQGQEVLSTHQKSIADTLAVIRSHFPLNLQFACCCRFIIDDAMSPTLKVKARVMDYLKDLLVMMPVDTISNPTNEIVKSIVRVIAWSTEPKSADVRRLASRVVIKLSDLNPAAFASMIQQMPKTSQDQSAKLLRTYQKTTTVSTSSHEPAPSNGLRTTTQLTKPHIGNGVRPFSPISATYVPAVQQEANSIRSPSKNRSLSVTDGRLATEASLSYGQSPPPPPYSANIMGLNSQMPNREHHYFPTASSNVIPLAVGDAFNLPQFSSPQYSYLPVKSPQHQPLPSLHSGLNNDLLCPKLKKPVIGYQTLKKIREFPPEDAITEILQELSNYNDRYEQRKACMLKLIKLLRDGIIQTWEEHSKPTLLILLESLSDSSSETRALALRVLQELVRTQGDLISDYACLTVMKILEACNDTDKGVIRSAEECAQTVSRYLSQELCLRLLTTVINENQTSLSLPAVKMQTHVVKVSSPELVQEVLPELIPGLIVACNHEDSHMRKAAIFCLVQIAIKFGDTIWGYLDELAASKKRLLRIYIDKELEGSGKSSESVGIGGNIPLA